MAAVAILEKQTGPFICNIEGTAIAAGYEEQHRQYDNLQLSVLY